MQNSSYDKPLHAILTLLEYLTAQDDVIFDDSSSNDNSPWLQSVVDLSESCDNLGKAMIEDGTFCYGINGHGSQGQHLDFLFSSRRLRLAASISWMPLYPLDAASHAINMEKTIYFLKLLWVLFTKFGASEGLAQYGDDNCLHVVRHDNSASFRIVSGNGDVIKEGNWLELLEILEASEETQNNLMRIWG